MFTEEQKKKVYADAVFMERMASDEVLSSLMSAPRTPEDERKKEFLLAVGGNPCICDIVVNPLTLGALSILGYVGSPFLFRSASLRPLDADIALYVLLVGRDALKSADLETDVLAHFSIAHDIDRAKAAREIYELIALSTAPLELLPDDGARSGKQCLFDMDWMTSIASQVHEASGEPADKIIWEMPLHMALSFLIQAKRKTMRGIDRKTDAEKILARMDELMAERLKEMDGANV